jgi:hypothetical protein
VAPPQPKGDVTVDPGRITTWALGIAGTWVVLTMMVDIGDTRDLAVALAIVIMGSVLLAEGPTALKNLGFI